MAAFAALAVLVGIGASSVLAARSQTQATTVKVSAPANNAFKFILSRKSVPHGKVSFVFTNKGSIKHDFSIAGKTTIQLGHNKSATLTVTLKKGKYPYKCTVDSHSSLGMRGTFTAT
jgi:plastocyanin